MCLHVLKTVDINKQGIHLKGLINEKDFLLVWSVDIFSSLTFYGNFYLSAKEKYLIFMSEVKSLMFVYTGEAQTYVQMVSLMKT